MSRLGTLFIAAAVLAATPAWAGGARAATVTIAPGGLAAALGMAAAGDVLVLASGIHPGPVNIATPVTLEGQPGSVIDGGGRENTVTVEAPGVTLRKLTIRNSGLSLFDQNSGIFLGKGAAGAVVEDNVLTDNLIGVYVWGAPNVLVRGNRVQGRTDLRRSERGNGIQLWNAPGTRVVGNTVTHGRDGIFVTTSKRNEFRDNRFENVRFAVHYMYTNDSEVSGNVSVGNDVGYAIMFSRNLVIRGNQSRGDREHGLLLNATTSSRIEDNLVAGRYATPVEDVAEDDDVADSDVPHEVGGLAESARIGTWKCVFVYNTSKNTVRNNRFEDCEIGIHFTAGSERNSISGNAFVNNRTQVKYVGTRALDWSEKGRGNYWSDNPAFDLNGDGVADEAYRPNDMVDRVMWSFPAAKLLINSPGIQVIRWAQSQFPALHPGGVMDSAPLMAPPDLPNTPGKEGPAVSPTIEVSGVSKRYGDQYAVRDVTVALGAGECVALVGHNGAGKSSLIKLLLGLTTPTRGTIRVLGEDPAGNAAARIRRQIGYLPENVAFHPAMTGRESLDFYARLKRVPTCCNDALLDRVGLETGARKHRIGTYSKGMRQRLGLAQALLGDPKLLFLDEPTTGLDPALRQGFYRIIGDLRDAGTTVLLCSHALTELEGQADRVIVMNRGRKVAEGSLATLRSLAQLPVRIRLTVPDTGFAALEGELTGIFGRTATRLAGGVVELVCANDDKLDIVRRIAGIGTPLDDMEIVQPSLDEMYAHFLRQEAAQ